MYLPVDIPVVRVEQPWLGRRRCGRRWARLAELVVEPQPEHADVECRLVPCVRGKDCRGVAEMRVEIFRARGPVGRKGDLGADSGCPSCTHVLNLVLVAGGAGGFDEACLRPRETAGPVDQPAIERVADTGAQRAKIIHLIGDRALRRGPRCGHTILQKVGERDVGFNSEHKPGRQHDVVPGLETAIQAAEPVTRTRRGGTEQFVVQPSAIVAEMTAEVEACPVIRTNFPCAGRDRPGLRLRRRCTLGLRRRANRLSTARHRLRQEAERRDGEDRTRPRVDL